MLIVNSALEDASSGALVGRQFGVLAFDELCAVDGELVEEQAGS